jgi:hypothetical protein
MNRGHGDNLMTETAWIPVSERLPDDHDPDQWWFWTDEWQEGERRVDEYIAAGEVETFNTIEKFIRSLQEDI